MDDLLDHAYVIVLTRIGIVLLLSATAYVVARMFISLDFAADIPRAAAIIRAEAEKHPDLLDERTSEDRAAGAPLVDVPVLNLDGSQVNFRIPLWAKDLPTAMRMTWDLHRSIKERFDREGIPLGRPSQVNVSDADLRALSAHLAGQAAETV